MEELKTINTDDKSKEPCAFCKKIMPFWNWLESRFGLLTCMDNYCKQTYSKGWSCLRVLSSTIAFAVFVQVMTGFVMWLSYSANAGSAWESVFNIQYNVTLGWLLRALGDPMSGLDAFVTILSAIATWWLTRSIPQQWILWIVADALGSWLCWRTGIPWMALLYLAYCLGAVYGLYHWLKGGRYVS